MSELRWYLILIGAAILLWIWYSGRRQSKAAKHDVFRNVSDHHDDVLMQDEAGNLRVDVNTPGKSFEEALAEVNAMEEPPRQEPELPEAASAAEVDTASADERMAQEPVLPDEIEDEIIIDTMASEAYPSLTEEEQQTPIAEADEAPATADELLQLIMLYVVAPEDKPFPGRAVLKSFHVHKLRFGEHQIFHRETSHADGRRIVFSISNMLKPGTLVPEETETADIHGLGVFMQIPNAIKPVDAFNDMLHTAQHLASTLGGELRDETLEPLQEETIALLRERLLEVT